MQGRYLEEVGTMGAVVGDVDLRGFGFLVLSSSLESTLGFRCCYVVAVEQQKVHKQDIDRCGGPDSF